MRAIVVGGGVAGPATALALRRVGVEAVVLEARTAEEMAAGSYLTLSPNGVHAADELGVRGAVARRGRSRRGATSWSPAPVGCWAR